jgi:hypothetical protein
MSLISRLRRNHPADVTEPPDGSSACQSKLFVHIPKTAGTSFRNSAVLQFGQPRILQDYGEERSATSQEIISSVYKSGDATSIIDAFANSGAVMVSGHVQITKYAGIIGLPNTVAFIREPVSRVVSHFRHMMRDEGFKGDLVKFINQPFNQNVQSRVLSQLDPALLGIVGITEQYQDSIDIINKRWNWGLNQRRDNISDKMSDFKVSLSSEEKAEIIKLNSKDLALYERAIHVFGNSLASLKSDSASDPRGAISFARTKQGISGWAFDMFSDEATEIDILVNQEVQSRIKCADFRAGLAGWRVPRCGYIGFHLKSVPLEDGDMVEIRDSELGLILDATVV